ncbi:MAG: putative toxin-antitoxin system toxin component, PIN family [Thermoplasmata archaeon]
MSTRVFVDANTLVSGLLFEGNESDVLELGALGAVELVTTRYVLAEVEEVLRRAEFQLTEAEVLDLVRYAHEAIAVLPDPAESYVRSFESRVRDKKDAPVWAGAVAAAAQFLLTGDKDLLEAVPQAIRTKALLGKILSGEV